MKPRTLKIVVAIFYAVERPGDEVCYSAPRLLKEKLKLWLGY